MVNARRLKAVVFDMDDTLTLERDYVRSGFAAVAAFAARRSGDDQGGLFALLWGWFEQGVRGDTFNRLLEARPALKETLVIADLVRAYREHTPRIGLLPGMGELLSELRGRRLKLGVLSDGPLPSQSAKVEALGLATMVDHVVLTDAWGRDFWKPDERGFVELSEKLGCDHRAMAYIGDNPEKDFIAPNRLGWLTIRLTLEPQLRSRLAPETAEATPHLNLTSVEALGTKLDEITQ